MRGHIRGPYRRLKSRGGSSGARTLHVCMRCRRLVGRPAVAPLLHPLYIMPELGVHLCSHSLSTLLRFKFKASSDGLGRAWSERECRSVLPSHTNTMTRYARKKAKREWLLKQAIAANLVGPAAGPLGGLAIQGHAGRAREVRIVSIVFMKEYACRISSLQRLVLDPLYASGHVVKDTATRARAIMSMFQLSHSTRLKYILHT